jgi:hypothetical protein
MIMLEDAAGAEEGAIEIKDVAELIAGRLEQADTEYNSPD